jgi:hypothetical protein
MWRRGNHLTSKEYATAASAVNTTRKTSAAAAVQHNAHDLRTPKHEGLYRYGRRCGQHNLLFHSALVGGTGGGAQPPPLVE